MDKKRIELEDNVLKLIEDSSLPEADKIASEGIYSVLKQKMETDLPKSICDPLAVSVNLRACFTDYLDVSEKYDVNDPRYALRSERIAALHAQVTQPDFCLEKLPVEVKAYMKNVFPDNFVGSGPGTLQYSTKGGSREIRGTAPFS